ncbi:hypothetical protein TNIN_210271 [Trichonephila inaurata madagascariensis]|uniref:Uncharacterized protein n=1 Tax=Trichonephila inaurata madagascariensis TaxID=2747483 RepID=A0A8X6JMB4_9ARAC|nr:hypothetical protein TNIN_210271 [Trichonephila inaurata madagascariensis]
MFSPNATQNSLCRNSEKAASFPWSAASRPRTVDPFAKRQNPKADDAPVPHADRGWGVLPGIKKFKNPTNLFGNFILFLKPKTPKMFKNFKIVSVRKT